jgi:DNA (cytosine-5)-methyltransferase 1
MKKKHMRNVKDFLEPDEVVEEKYTIKSDSMKKCIDPSNFDTAKISTLAIIKNYACTITTKQDRCPNAGIVKRRNGSYRLLTEKECWRLQGYDDEDFYAAELANPTKDGFKNGTLYKQAGNSIPVTILESMFEAMLNGTGFYKEDNLFTMAQ